MRFFRSWIVLLPLILIVIFLAVFNNHPAPINLEPLPLVFEPPLWALVMVFAGFGLIGGLLVGAVKAGRWRARARRAEAEVARLEGELRRERDGTPPAITGPPARAA